MKLSDKVDRKHFYSFTKEDFSRENFIEGGVIRPALLMAAFTAFMIAMFLLLLGLQGNIEGFKWGGSLIIFSFILNLYGIYLSFQDHPSFFKNMNIVFKLTLFVGEIVAFNWVLAKII